MLSRIRTLISFQRAARWSLGVFGLLILFHLGVILTMLFSDVNPVDYLWGGRMESREQLLQFEGVSLAVILLCFFLVLVVSERIHLLGWKRIAQIAMWVLFVLFLLNTLGNIVAKTAFEQSMAVVTAMLAFLCLRLALGKET